MRRTAAGEIEAFGELVRRHQNNLLNFFRHLGAHMDKAEDLTQETFLRLYQWRQRYEPTARFKTFLFTLARHAWVDSLRKEARTVRTAGGELPEYVPDARAHPEHAQTHLDIREALAALSEKLRAVVVLNVYHGLAYKEIGEILEIPEGTVKSRMFQALRQLRSLLSQENRDG